MTSYKPAFPDTFAKVATKALTILTLLGMIFIGSWFYPGLAILIIFISVLIISYLLRPTRFELHKNTLYI